jgi:hypothetical protein
MTVLALALVLQEVRDEAEAITIETPAVGAVVRKKGYVTGVAGGSFVDRKSGFRDAGFGLDVVDWIMEPGSDEAYRDRLDKELVYEFNNACHGKRPKRSIEGPQICTKARALEPAVIRGPDFVAVRSTFRYQTAAPGKNVGSTWTQLLVFPRDARYFVAADRIDAVNSSEAMFLRIDMPGHVKHERGDTFTDVYLSYSASGASQVLPSESFEEDFAPDERNLYRRDVEPAPGRFIRAYRVRDPKSGRAGPWLAGMTLDPAAVYEAWCHQRGYVCMIQEIGGRPVKAGESFGAAYIVGWFDSIEEMNRLYDRFKGSTKLEADEKGWKLSR